MSSPSIETLFGQLKDSLQKKPAQALFSDGTPVYIYGAGNAGKDIFNLLVKHGIRVAGFLDRSAKPGAEWRGAPILLPNDASLSPATRKRAHVVMGVFNREVAILPIRKMLLSIGFGRVSSFLDLHDELRSKWEIGTG